MALNPKAYVALVRYCERAVDLGPYKEKIRNAVILTPSQRLGVSAKLSSFWNRAIECPLQLDLVPQHGFRSRVLKDGFSPEQFAEWLVVGCSDVASVGQDPVGRPFLIVPATTDPQGHTYDVVVPIRSDATGHVHIDDVIPKGLAGKKKQPPRQFPWTIREDAEPWGAVGLRPERYHTEADCSSPLRMPYPWETASPAAAIASATHSAARMPSTPAERMPPA